MTNESNTKQKRIFRGAVLAAVVLMLAAVCCVGAGAAISGDGSEGNPYQISTALDLYTIATTSSYFHGEGTSYFKLVNDIEISDISSITTNEADKTVTVTSVTKGEMIYNWGTQTFDESGWSPKFDDSVASFGLSSWPTIGNHTKVGDIYPYDVTKNIVFDGNNKKISGLFINTIDGFQGLFGYVADGASIKIRNLTLEKSFVCTSGSFNGVLIGISYSKLPESLIIDNCNLTDCSVIGTGTMGGIVGWSTGNPKFTNCHLINCNVVTLDLSTAGGVIGGTYQAILTIDGCSASQSNFEGCKVGGLVGGCNTITINNSHVSQCTITGLGSYTGGMISYAGPLTCIDCIVDNCIITNAPYGKSYKDDPGVGGLIGSLRENGIIKNCNVINFNTISGEYDLGGFIGHIYSSLYSLEITNSTVSDTSIIGDNIPDGKKIGGLVAGDETDSVKVDKNTLNNVQIIVKKGYAQYAYLFDVTKYPIHSTNGIAKLAEIDLTNDNKIINSYVLKADGVENTNLDGFSELTTEFAITVSNHDVTSIKENEFEESKLTGLFKIDSVNNIGVAAFKNSKLSGGFYVPGTVSIASDAFAETTNLKVIYGDVTAGLTGLNENTATVNIASVGTIDKLSAGTFAVSEPEPFKTVLRGNTPTDKFKDLSSGTYLLSTDSWAAGKAYLVGWNTTITLNSKNGVGGTPLVDIALYSADFYPAITAPTKVGYTLSGWNDENSGGVMVISSTGILQSAVDGYTNEAGVWINTSPSLNLYANWTAHTYTVTFNNNTGTGTMADQAFTYDVAQSLSPNTFAKTGYTFAGWATTSDGEVVYADKASVNNLVADDKGTFALYAKWTPNTYKITYKDAGDKAFSGTHESGYPTTHTYDSETTLKSASKAGYVFNGWYTDSAAAEKIVTTLGATEYEEDITLYANWTVYTKQATASDKNIAAFGAEDDITALHSDVSVGKVLLKEVSQVTGVVTFIADNTELHIPSINGYTNEEIAIFDITADGVVEGTPAKFTVTVTFKDEQTATANKENVRFFHYTNSAWEELKRTITETVGASVTYSVETKSFSPFSIGIYTPNSQPSHSSSSRDYGSSIWLPATAEPTAAPTPAAEPTQAVPTASPVKPTPQASSPAPFFGLLAGLGAAAVLFRLRRK